MQWKAIKAKFAGLKKRRLIEVAAPRGLIELRGVQKMYESGSGGVSALQDIQLIIQAGEFVAISGKSGSGKSTLLNMITGIDHPTSGEIFIQHVPVHRLNEARLTEWRGRAVGIVFQFFQLLPTMTLEENVILPMDFCGCFGIRARRARARQLLEQVGLLDLRSRLPAQVSGGQQQRAAIARALANDPPILVADEPTGNLDSASSEAVFGLLEDLVRQGKTVIIVTHDGDLARRCHRVITIADGQIISDHPSSSHGKGHPMIHLEQPALSGEQAHVWPTLE